MKDIPSLIAAALLLCWPLARANAALSDGDAIFLKQCKVSPADIDVVPQLASDIQERITSWTATNDCRKVSPFKVSRAYYGKLKQLKPKAKIPQAPVGWSVKYLTDDELSNYSDIMDNAL